MNSDSNPQHQTSRREFLSRTVAATALAGVAIPHVHGAAGDNHVRLALIGSGNRGSGAVANAMEAPGSPVKLTTMADLYEDRLNASHRSLLAKFGERVDVPTENRFIGFDAYKKAIDTLRPGSGDVAMLTGYAAFRPQQLEYAVSKGVNVFMEKSFATDPVGVRRVIAAGEAAEKKGLKIMAGLMCRHSRNRWELIRRIKAGELGEVLHTRAYRMQGIGGLAPKPANKTDLEWQLRNFTKFLWVSGGLWAEMDIHQIDELCWLHDAWPVSAHGVGGRVANSKDCSQNLDSFNVEWTFPNGSKGYHTVRYIPKCEDSFVTYVHGTKKAAMFSGNIHAGTVEIYKDQRIGREYVEWRAPKEEKTAWDMEWMDFLEAIRENKPFNEAKRAGLSNLADIMGRAAVHMGRTITWDEAMASNFQWFPGKDTMTHDTEPPIKADAEGRYPVPVPGAWKEI
ncbi:MAG: Gfo/Idh/MocA family oxidoreductase [Verrucomicrobia bacterium]|nr:Gfo/Idh/MocA family oxidoreductase [Verrucomicrobiota bacterium]